MITHITKGVDPHRVQTGEPPYFVAWKQNGKMEYRFFAIVSSMYTFKEALEKEAGKSKP